MNTLYQLNLVPIHFSATCDFNTKAHSLKGEVFMN